MDISSMPEPPAPRRITEIFSWEIYPRKLPKPPKYPDRMRLKRILSMIIVLELVVSAALFIIPFSPDYTAETTVEGRVFDSSGIPVPLSTVSLDTGETATTDHNGRFVFQNIQAGLRTFYFFTDGGIQKHESFVANYHDAEVSLVGGDEVTSLPVEIRDWKHLNGLFFGSALLVMVFAMVSMLGLLNERKPSIAFSACAMSVITAVLVLQTTFWMDVLAGILLFMGLLGMLYSYRVMKRNRTRLLTSEA